MTTTYKFKDARIIDGCLYGCSMTTEREVSDGPRNDPNTVTTKVKFTIDYDGIPLDKMLNLSGSTLVIRRQNNVWKKQTPEQIKQDENTTIHWSQMGISGGAKAPSMVATLANIMIQNGVPEAQAIERASKIASDPEKLKMMLETMGMMEA